VSTEAVSTEAVSTEAVSTEAVSTEELLCFQKASSVRASNYKDMGWPKQFYVCGECVYGNSGLRCNIAEKIFGHCL
jgi:hypothetical protein